MHLLPHNQSKVFEFSGIHHQTILSGPESKECSLWLDTFSPDAQTPLHYCTCEQVITVLSGSGEVTVGGHTYELEPETTVLVPPYVVR
jgi:quercetin dioxygenase-like cupin family protein